MSSPKGTRSWNSFMVLFVVISVLAGAVLIMGIGALVFPDAGIPFVWVAFPVGPQPAPIPMQ
ncbi:MAG TPA: hypothetical protein ENI62_04765 [Gammaproteobacteria bacterium]|nr:hypothetical protein [Gammaproteobacteria bacterium]